MTPIIFVLVQFLLILSHTNVTPSWARTVLRPNNFPNIENGEIDDGAVTFNKSSTDVLDSLVNTDGQNATTNEPRSGRTRRVIGGCRMSIVKVPYQVRLEITIGSKIKDCGGVIVGDDAIITAAHCVHACSRSGDCSSAVRPNKIRVFAGEILRNLQSDYVQTPNVKSVHLHPNFKLSLHSSQAMENDIAYLNLKDLLTFQHGVDKIQVAWTVSSKAIKKSKMEVSGWGGDDHNGMSTCLRVAQLRQVSQETCAEVHDSTKITKNVICAESVDSVSQPCEGDSGGPLVIYQEPDRKPLLLGIVSWGYNLRGPHDKPTVFTRITEFSCWMHKSQTSQRSTSWIEWIKEWSPFSVTRVKSSCECKRCNRGKQTTGVN